MNNLHDDPFRQEPTSASVNEAKPDFTVSEPKVIQPLAYTLKETAQILGLSPRTIRRLHKKGLILASRGTRRLIFSRKNLERFLDATSV